MIICIIILKVKSLNTMKPNSIDSKLINLSPVKKRLIRLFDTDCHKTSVLKYYLGISIGGRRFRRRRLSGSFGGSFGGCAHSSQVKGRPQV